MKINSSLQNRQVNCLEDGLFLRCFSSWPSRSGTHGLPFNPKARFAFSTWIWKRNPNESSVLGVPTRSGRFSSVYRVCNDSRNINKRIPFATTASFRDGRITLLGYVQCVGDFNTRDDARPYARGRFYRRGAGRPDHHLHCHPRNPESSDTIQVSYYFYYAIEPFLSFNSIVFLWLSMHVVCTDSGTMVEIYTPWVVPCKCTSGMLSYYSSEWLILLCHWTLSLFWFNCITLVVHSRGYYRQGYHANALAVNSHTIQVSHYFYYAIALFLSFAPIELLWLSMHLVGTDSGTDSGTM